MRVAVTGGAGFIGAHLCEALLGGGHDVLCMDNLSSGARENIAPLRKRRGFGFLRHDVRRPIRAARRVEAIYHLASRASPADFERYPLEIATTSALGTLRVLEWARAAGARVLFTSTSEVYGDPPPEFHPQREEYRGWVSTLGPRAPYDESKRFAETLCSVFARGADSSIRNPKSKIQNPQVDVRVVRIFNTYGPRMREEDGRVVPNFIRQALRNGPLTVQGDGKQTRSFCYISDMVAGLMRAMERDAASLLKAGPINIGNPQEVTVLELAERIRKITGSSSGLKFVPLPQDDPLRRRPDISKARRILGWEPTVPLDEGLRRTIEWFGDASR